jgi:hypothetical protein
MPTRLTAEDLYSLEEYAARRPGFRAQVLAHKKARSVALGPHMRLVFEDRLSVHYQVQEMLRIENVASPEGIADELAAYNPLIPDGSNLKATCLIEFTDPQVRARELMLLKRIENHLFLEVGTLGRTVGIADEDLDRSNEDKTSAVHFLRFELTADQVQAWRAGASVTLGVDDERYGHATLLPAATRAALAEDFGQPIG